MAPGSKAKNGKNVTATKRGPTGKAKVTKRPMGKSPKLSPARQGPDPTAENSTEDTGAVDSFPFSDLPRELQLQVIKIAATSAPGYVLRVERISRHYPAPIAKRRFGTHREVLDRDIANFNAQKRRSEHRTALAFAMTCRAVREEFSKVYYSGNVFHIPRPSDVGRFIRALGPNSSYLKQIITDLDTEQPNWRQLAALPNLCGLKLTNYPLRCHFLHPQSLAWQEDRFARGVERGLTYLLQHAGKQLVVALVIAKLRSTQTYFNDLAFVEMLERLRRHGVVARSSEIAGWIDVVLERGGA